MKKSIITIPLKNKRKEELAYCASFLQHQIENHLPFMNLMFQSTKQKETKENIRTTIEQLNIRFHIIKFCNNRP